MTDASVDLGMIEVWVSMANHFLDTETRHSLPQTALRCVEAGLSAAQARDIWRFEIVPAVGSNVLGIGEWAYWDRAWLIERISKVRVSWWNRRGPWRRLHPALYMMRDYCLAIERCSELLHAVEPAAREQLARDLVELSRVMVDFTQLDSPMNAPDRERLSQIYPAPFKAVMWSSLLSSEVADAERRIQRVLYEVAP